MSFYLKPMGLFSIQNELRDYQKLCAQYRFNPSDTEFKDIVQFILLNSGDGGIYESIDIQDKFVFNYLRDNFDNTLLLERGGGGHLENDGADWESAVGASVGAAKAITGSLVVGAVIAGVYISFLFKKNKLRASIKKELELEMKKLDHFGELSKLKIEYTKLTGGITPKLTGNMPTMVEGPELEKPEKPGQK